MKSLKLNYHNISSNLCEIEKKYNVGNYRNRHPYTLFYNGLFTNKKNDNLKIAELEISDSNSLLLWSEYFKNAEIYGIDYNKESINPNSISKAFSKSNTLFDIIIEGTSHKFEDQITVIENVYQHLKPGGVLIIEDIFKSYNEKWYINRLKPILQEFQDYYFLEIDYSNKKKTVKNNDKLLVLIKSGGSPIFENENKITIITPSYRVDNLLNVKNSINFKYVEQWIIVYDGSKITNNPYLFKNQENDKIKEYVYFDQGSSGNPQRNYALSKLTKKDTSIYYLDDDNVINPNIYSLLNIMEKNKMYTFNQYNPTSPYSEKNILKGNNICVRHIDTAMVIIPYQLCKDIQWIFDNYFADGFYIQDCYANNKNNHIFVDNELCYYNSMCA
jgi:hypothetical protein